MTDEADKTKDREEGGRRFKITHAKCLCHAAELHSAHSAQESKHTHMLTPVLSLHILCAHPLEKYMCGPACTHLLWCNNQHKTLPDIFDLDFNQHLKHIYPCYCHQVLHYLQDTVIYSDY